MRKNENLWVIRRDGNLGFTTRSKITRLRSRPDTMWNHPLMLIVIIATCGLVDLLNFKQVFDAFIFDSLIARIVGILAFLIAFDFIPIWAGLNLKKKNQGYKVNTAVIKIMTCAFILAFVVNFALRIATREMVLPEGGVFSGEINGDVTTPALQGGNHMLVYVYAVLTSIVPLITSLASGGISFLMSNPLHKEMMDIEKRKNLLLSDIESVNATLEEYDADKAFFERMLKDDAEKYAAARIMVTRHQQYLKDYVRERLAEHLADPTSTTVLTANNAPENVNP